MACRTLLRRKTQMDLLERACEQRAAAHIGLRGKTATNCQAELAAIERDGILITWVHEPLREAEVEGRSVEVRFEHEGECYVFYAVSWGRVGPGLSEVEAEPRVKLSLPLRVERARHRRHIRVALLRNLPPIEGTFTHVVDGRRQFQARLTDIADGGMGVTARTEEVTQLYTGDLFWVDMKLPGEKARAEFVVRLIHLRPIRNTDRLAMGWAFQPTDDVSNYETYLQRLEAFIARKQPPGSVMG